MISKFFIERPVLANVIALLMIVVGAVALFKMPVAQYPDVVPPTVSVTTRYPGASARTVIDTVALPIEQQVNGVEGMIYMQSYAASDTQVLRQVRLPNALPFLLTGLRIGASLAVIAAVVVEYFGGLQNGLGSRVTSAMKQSATAKAWAYIGAACALGLLFYVAAVVIEWLAMPWQRRRSSAN